MRFTVILPFIISFFYLFIRNLSTSSMYIACLIGLGLMLFSNSNTVKNEIDGLGWGKVVALMGLIFLVSIVFYYFSGVSLSYVESPYSIVLTMLPFVVFFRRLDKEESLIYVLIFLFIGSGILSYWLGDQSEYSARVISSRYFKLLYVAPLLIVFKWMQLDMRTYIAIVSAGITGVLVSIVITYLFFRHADGGLIDTFTHEGPISANTNPIFFGLISLCLTLPIYLAIFFGVINKKNLFLLAILLVVGVVGILQSGSRGVWLALFSILFIGFIYFLFNKEIANLSKLVSISTIVLMGIVFLSSQVFKERLEQAIHDVESFGESENAQQIKLENSLGTRFELWRASILIFREHSLFGVGPGGFSNELSALAEKNELNPDFVTYKQAHSQYFHTLATKGVIGIIILLLLLSVLLWVPCRRIFNYTNAGHSVKYFACCGVAVILAYAILGLTESPFERRSAIVFFVFFYSLTFAAMKSTSAQKHELQ